MEILDKRRLPFVQIEKALVMSRDLSHAGFRIYCALACRANAEGKAWPSLTRLARDLGMGKSTVCRAIAEIEKAKLVTVDRGDAEAGDPDHNVYVLTGYPVQNGTGGPLQYRGGPPAYRNENTLNEKEESLSLVHAREANEHDTLTPELRTYATAQGCTDPDDCFEGYVLQFVAAKRSARRFQRWARDGHGGPDWKACRCQTRPPPGTPHAARASPVAPGLIGVQAVARKLQLAGEL